MVKSKTYKPQNPIATIQIEGYEKPIKIELDPQSAPNAVANFVKLVNNGYYTNFKMSIESNRLLGDESMQMAKLSNIVENPAEDYVYGIKGDFIVNGYDNLKKHKKGVVTMERDDYSYFGYTEEGYNSANCNFCILTEDLESYDGYYAAFGEIVEGMDVLDAIAATRVEESEDENSSESGEVDISGTETSSDETSSDSEETSESGETSDSEETEDDVNTITISSITVDTFGIDYGLPETVNYEETINKVNEQYSNLFGGDTAVTTEE